MEKTRRVDHFCAKNGCELKNKFDSWSTDSHSLIEGSAVCIPGIDIHKDDV